METDNRIKLYETAKSCLGKDMAPLEDDFGCAEAVNAVYKKAFGREVGGGLSTNRMYYVLRNDTRFEKVPLGLPGDILISPTGYGNGKVRNGHVGIVSDTGKIMSNTSSNGLWEENYLVEVWKRKFKDYGGFPMDFFRVKTPVVEAKMPDIVVSPPLTDVSVVRIALLQALLEAYQKLLALISSRQLGAARSIKWPVFQKENIKDKCEACGTSDRILNRLNLHHIAPFHLYPELELSKGNVITLCRTCHFLVGHLRSWKSFNANIKLDAQLLFNRIKNRP